MKANLFTSGSVQGVGYRSHVKRAAHQHHIKGFAKNLPDGRVEVFAIFDTQEQLDAFLKELDRKSSSFIGMHVEKIDIKTQAKPGFNDYGDFDDFQIQF